MPLSHAHLHFLPLLAPLDRPVVGGGRAGCPWRHLTTTRDRLEELRRGFDQIVLRWLMV